MIAIPESEQARIARELQQEEIVRLARNIEDETLTRHDNDYKETIHDLSLQLASTKIK